MTNTPPPEQRRALQRAADRDIHPIAPPPDEFAERAPVAPTAERAPVAPTAERAPVAPSSKGKKSNVAVKAGKSTADAVSPKKDKLVGLDVKVPKSLRTALRAEAERRGMTVDQLVEILLGDRATR